MIIQLEWLIEEYLIRILKFVIENIIRGGINEHKKIIRYNKILLIKIREII